MRILVTKDFNIFKAGEEYETTTGSVANAYAIETASGLLYLPSVNANVISAETSAPVPPVPSEIMAPPIFKGAMTPEEVEVLKAVSAGSKSVSREIAKIFTEDASMSLDEKIRIQAELKCKEARKNLKFSGEPRLKEGQFWLTDLTEGTLPSSGVDHVITCHTHVTWINDSGDNKWYLKINPDNPWFHDFSFTDIPDIQRAYCWQPDVLEAIVLSYKMNLKCLLTGPPGTGKTSAVKQYAAWTDHPYMRFNGKDGIDQTTLLGSIWVSGGKMEWKDGLLVQGLKMGYIVCMDEVFKIPPGIQMALQTVYEKEGTLILDDKPGTLFEKTVVPDPSSRMFMTDNVKGTGDMSSFYSSTQMQDTSTIDRFGITVNVPYLTFDQEVSLMMDEFKEDGAKLSLIQGVVKFAGLIREAYMEEKMSLTLSQRGLAVMVEAVLKQGLPIQHAINYGFTNKIGDDIELQLIEQFITTVYGN